MGYCTWRCLLDTGRDSLSSRNINQDFKKRSTQFWSVCSGILTYFSFSFIFTDFNCFYRGEGRQQERERNIKVWLLLMRPLLGTWPATQACVLDWESNQQPFELQAGTQATDTHQPRLKPFFYFHLEKPYCISVFICWAYYSNKNHSRNCLLWKAVRKNFMALISQLHFSGAWI